MIDDHRPVTATLKLSVPSQVVAERKVWLFRDADLERLQDSLADTCSGHIADQSTSSATERITDTTILRSARSCIPLTTLPSGKSSHPWFTYLSVVLVDARRAAEGTPLEKETTLTCSAGPAAAYHDYTAHTALKMPCLGTASKLW